VSGFEFTDIGEVRKQMGADGASSTTATGALRSRTEPAQGRLVRIATTAIYASDAVVRRSPALQAHPLARSARVTLNPEDALALGLGAGSTARVSGAELPVELSSRVPRGGAWIEAGLKGSAQLPPHGASLDITKA
jgi:NADH-quinone oxidoreductase subunit G